MWAVMRLLGVGTWVPGAYLAPWRGRGVWAVSIPAISIPEGPAAVSLLWALGSVAISVSVGGERPTPKVGLELGCLELPSG